MEIFFYIIGSSIFGIGLGMLIGQSIKPKCNHVWDKIEDGELFRYDSRGKRQQKVGFMKVYECQHCKEMRKEQVFI